MTKNITATIVAYNQSLESEYQSICEVLSAEITLHLTGADQKIWHGHPVWFLDENPIVGYSKQKAGIRLMFWSGAGFGEDGLSVRGPKFQDASVFYNTQEEIDLIALKRWIDKSIIIQWDYKNLVKRKGVLLRLK